MTDSIKYPTWSDVGVPVVMADSIKAMKPCFLLDSLVYQVVFHNIKRMQLLYSCDVCSRTYVPERNSEEVVDCGFCGNRSIHATQSLRFDKEKIPSYSRTDYCSLFEIIRTMDENYSRYFKLRRQRNSLDWDWENRQYKIQFLGGEAACGSTPRITVVKAALLCPYLWDSLYNWSNDTQRDKTEQKHISHFINQWTSRCWRE